LLSTLFFLLVGKLVSLKKHLLIKLLSLVNIGVDEAEAGGSATTKLALDSEDSDSILWGLVQAGELGLDVSLGDATLVWMDQLNVHLSSSEKWVVNNLSGVKYEVSWHFFNKFRRAK
jgi:hypothetical protein